ncbi:hypothetical protein P3T25_009216 [Paraburkholderia sp. GAS32]
MPWESRRAAHQRARRLRGRSKVFLLCYTFGATKGFILDIEHNGAHFRTDEHAQTTAPFFTADSSCGDDGMKEGAVSIAFPTRAVAERHSCDRGEPGTGTASGAHQCRYN